jgi:hypothetical protein
VGAPRCPAAPRRLRAATAWAAVAALVLAGCGSSDPPQAATTPTATPSPTATATPKPRPDVPRAHCPADVAGCQTTRGTVFYVERVDPDGDGDLHVVLEDRNSLTLPGITSVDVARDLRPERDPEIGDRVSAAGPLQRGSYGQMQIHAVEFHTRHG